MFVCSDVDKEGNEDDDEDFMHLLLPNPSRDAKSIGQFVNGLRLDTTEVNLRILHSSSAAVSYRHIQSVSNRSRIVAILWSLQARTKN